MVTNVFIKNTRAYKNANQKGFTIIELMIASMVFSVLIIMVSAVTLGVAKQYQKATYTAQLNDASRNVHQTISQTIGYGGDYSETSVDGYKVYCAGTTRLFYKPSTDTAINNGLYRQENTTDCGDTINIALAENLLPKNGFITEFSVNKIGANNAYNIKTTFKVGTVDMFETTPNIVKINNKCLPTLKGGDFCTEVTYTNVVVAKLR